MFCQAIKTSMDGLDGGDVEIGEIPAYYAVPKGKGKRPVDWQRTSQVAAAVLADLLEQLPDPGRFWNVNLPYLEADDPLPEVVFCEASVDALPVAYRIEGDQFFYSAKYGDRPRTAGTDVDVCFSGHVAVTQLGL